MAISSSGISVEQSVAGNITVSVVVSLVFGGVGCIESAGKAVNDIKAVEKQNNPMLESFLLAITPPDLW
jgi:hypothetical protein